MVEIYHYAPHLVNKTVTPSAIEECEALFFSASWAIKKFGASLFAEEVKSAPFLPLQFQDFFMGGMDDNSAWTAFMWNRMLSWARHSPPPAPLPPAPRLPRRLPPALHRFVSSLRPLLRDGTLHADIIDVRTDAAGGITMGEKAGALSSQGATKVHAALLAATNTSLPLRLEQHSSLALPRMTADAQVQLAVAGEGAQANEYFGTGLCAGDFDGDHKDVRAIDRPYCLFVDLSLSAPVMLHLLIFPLYCTYLYTHIPFSFYPCIDLSIHISISIYICIYICLDLLHLPPLYSDIIFSKRL